MTDLIPDIATMYQAHSNRRMACFDSRILHLFEGWGDGVAPNLYRHEMSGMPLRSAPLEGTEDSFDIDMRGTPKIEVSLRILPDHPTVVVLRPCFLQLE